MRNNFIFGTRSVIEAIKSDKNIDKLFIQKGLNNELIKELLQLVQKFHIPLSKVPIEKLNRITCKNHQGVICFLSPIGFASLENIITNCYGQGIDPFLLILDQVTDVRNFGAICRSAECLGVDAVVIPFQGAAQINEDAMKTSAGALNYLPIVREKNLLNVAKNLKNNGIRLVSCTEKAGVSIQKEDLKGPIAVIVGSEEHGISSNLLKISNSLVKIPMSGKIGTLNVSVSVGIALYEVGRQRN